MEIVIIEHFIIIIIIIIIVNIIYNACVNSNCETLLRDTHRENTTSTKTRALTKSMNIDIWVIGTSNQLFIGDSYT